MVAVRGSRQHQMIVVRHRPYYKAMVFTVLVAAVSAMCWLTFRYGFDEGVATRENVVQERAELRIQLQANTALILSPLSPALGVITPL